MSLSFYKYILYLKFLNYKTNYFISNNKIEFIISHYKENFDYLKYLPNNQKITIYIKSNIKPPINKKNIKVVFLENVGKEYQTYLYHIIKNYENLSQINFFLSASFLNVKDRTKNFTKVYNKIASFNKKRFNGLYTSDDEFFLFKKEKLKVLDPKMRIYEHITSQNVKHKMILSKIYPLENYFYYYFKNKKLDKFIRSLNGIFATDKENILSIKKEIYKNIIEEYKIIDRDYESGHYLERLYPSIFKLEK